MDRHWRARPSPAGHLLATLNRARGPRRTRARLGHGSGEPRAELDAVSGAGFGLPGLGLAVRPLRLGRVVGIGRKIRNKGAELRYCLLAQMSLLIRFDTVVKLP
jgi:hypothetical protein